MVLPNQLAVGTQPISRTYNHGLRYRACRPDEYLVKSGMGVQEEVVTKKTFQWPFQVVTVIRLVPRNYNFTLHCISADMVPFDLPVVFTIGPYDPTMDATGFRRYASKMSAMTEKDLHEVVLGVVHGQTRLYAAGLTVIQMFNDRDSFKMHVQERIAKELISFGLQVFNGNVAEMRDSEGNAYFSSLKQKAISGAVNKARVETALAKKDGDIGESEGQADAKIRMAEIAAKVTAEENIYSQEIAKSKLTLQLGENQVEADTKIRKAEIAANVAEKENIYQQQVAKSKLEQALLANKREADAKIRMAEITATVTGQENIFSQQIAKSKLTLDLANLEYKQKEETQHVQAQMAPKQLEAELQTELNKLDGMRQQELLRATDLAKTVVKAEATIKEAEAQAAAQRQLADAQLYTEKQRAEGMKATSEAQAEGLRKLLTVADTDLVKFYLANENGLFEKLASTTADAVRGMAPKIHIWNTGPEGSGDAYGPLQKLFTSLPPMLNAVQSQTDVRLPQWFPQEAAPKNSVMPPQA